MRIRMSARNRCWRFAWVAWLMAAAAQAAGPATPAAPDREPPLIEQQRPAILDVSIPPERRADLSGCGETSSAWLDEVAQTCWPVLQAAQRYTLAEFAAYEAINARRKERPDTPALKSEALEKLEAFFETVGEPRWPLEKFLLIKALAEEALLHEAFGDYPRALRANARLIALAERATDDRGAMEFRLAAAYMRHGEYLLALSRRQEAGAVHAKAFALLDTPYGYKNAWFVSKLNSLMALDAIAEGETDAAQAIVDRYLARARMMDTGMQLGLTRHIDLKLYLSARQGRAEEVLALMDERLARERHSQCIRSDRLFPYVLAPLRDDPAVADRLSAIACSARDLARMDEVAANGLLDPDGKVLLPPERSH